MDSSYFDFDYTQASFAVSILKLTADARAAFYFSFTLKIK
jgi:hypothetical protein